MQRAWWAGALALFLAAGCATTKPPISSPPSTTPAPPKKSAIRMHLEGDWESPGKASAPKRLTFLDDGTLKFEGGLDYFNPGQWAIDEDRHELKITLPQADDEKLQIFQLYVGDSVKAFDRKQKQITYHFDEQTWTLNVGGWPYSKIDPNNLPAQPEAEPVFK